MKQPTPACPEENRLYEENVREEWNSECRALLRLRRIVVWEWEIQAASLATVDVRVLR